MGTTLATGLSKGADSAVAAAKAVQQAKDKLGGGRVDLSLVYSSSEYNYQAVVDTVRAGTGNAPLIGCSSAGEFTEEKVEQGSIAVGLIASDDIRFATAIADGVKEDPERAVRTVANKLPLKMKDSPHLSAIFLIDGLAGVGEEMTVLASAVFNQTFGKNVKLAGGAAGDDLKCKETFVFSDDSIATDSVSVCLFASKKPLYTGVQHGHIPASELLRVTRAEGCVLYEIDGRPAWDVWKERTAKSAGKIGIDVGTIEEADMGAYLSMFELGLPDVGGLYKIRVGLGKNEDDSLNFGCTIPEGVTFRIMESKKENQIISARVAAEIAKENSGDGEIAGAMVFDCVCRGLILGDEFHKGVDQIKDVLGDVPVLGCETYGEICMDPGQFSAVFTTPRR